MTGFGLGSATGMKEITSDQGAQWDFGNFFVPFGIPKMMVFDEDGIFSGIFRKNLQETLRISVHAVARGNHKKIRN